MAASKPAVKKSTAKKSVSKKSLTTVAAKKTAKKTAKQADKAPEKSAAKSTPKTTVNDASVRAFLDKSSSGQRREDCETVLGMMTKATGEGAKMWGASIIGFGTYRYQYASGRSGEWPIIGFSPRKTDLTLYLMPGVEAFPALAAKLGKYKNGKSCLYLKSLADVDLDVLRQLIDASVQAMEPKRVR